MGMLVVVLTVQPASRALSAMSALPESQEPPLGRTSDARGGAPSDLAVTLAAAIAQPLEHPAPPAEDLPGRLVMSEAPTDVIANASVATAAINRGPSPFFLSMYMAFGTLQTIDAYTTLRALRYNGREVNPLVAAVQEYPAGVIAVKSAVTFGTVYVSEKLRKRNKLVAGVTVAAVNSAYLWVAAHNVRVNRQLNEIARRGAR